MPRDSRPAPDPGMPPEILHDRIRETLAATDAPRFRTRDRIVLALAIVPLLTLAVSFIASGLVYHRPAPGLAVHAENSARLAWTLASLAALTLGVTLISFWRGRQGFGAGALNLAVAATLAVPLYGLLTVVEPVHMSEDAVAGVVVSPWGVRCALIAAVVGLSALVSFTAALRRAVPVANRLRGAAVGAAAGAWAGLAVFMFCPSADPQHLIAGHVLPLLALSCIGLLLIPRWLRP